MITETIVDLSESVIKYKVTVSTSRADSVPFVFLFSNALSKSHFNFKINNVGTPLTLSVNVGWGIEVCTNCYHSVVIKMNSKYHLANVLAKYSFTGHGKRI